MTIRRTFILITLALTAACSSPSPSVPPQSSSTASSPAASAVEAQAKRFAPVDISASTDGLPATEVEALKHIVLAARVMDGIFLEQVWAGNPALMAKLSADTSAEGRAELHYFMINKGPWSRLDHNAPFVRKEFNVPAKPEQANFYPADATKEEVDKWIASLKGDAHAQATGFFTVIRRGADGKLAAVPYHVEYQKALTDAAAHLRAAAAATAQPTLKKFLELRAKAVGSPGTELEFAL